jgi:hypothetical protein
MNFVEPKKTPLFFWPNSNIYINRKRRGYSGRKVGEWKKETQGEYP